jgi:hypothetical protein
VTVLPARRTSNRSPPARRLAPAVRANPNTTGWLRTAIVRRRAFRAAWDQDLDAGACYSGSADCPSSVERAPAPHGRSIRAGGHTNCGVRIPQTLPFAVTRARASNAAGDELPNLASCALRRGYPLQRNRCVARSQQSVAAKIAEPWAWPRFASTVPRFPKRRAFLNAAFFCSVRCASGTVTGTV